MAWECENLAPTLPGYNLANMEGVGLDIIILSVGTNDAARIQKFGGIKPDVDLDRLVHIHIELWPAQIMDMYKGLMTCLDPHGKVFFFLPIGITSISNNDTGIAYFRQLAIHFAKQFPRIVIVDNANMIRNNRAIPSMIRLPNDPHFSERGRSQVIANLKVAMRFSMPALSAYSTTVNDHMIKRRRDPHRTVPHAQFLRWGAAHTGIPDPPSPSEVAPPPRPPRSSEPAAPSPPDTAAVSVDSIVRQCGLDQTYSSYATVAGQGARPSAEASTGRPQPESITTQGSYTRALDPETALRAPLQQPPAQPSSQQLNPQSASSQQLNPQLALLHPRINLQQYPKGPDQRRNSLHHPPCLSPSS